MKKFLILIAVTALFFSSSSNAIASFGYDELIRVVYSTASGATNEQITDMGPLSSFLSGTTTISSNPISASSLGTGATASNTYVAYFVKGANYMDPIYVTGSGSTQSNMGGYYDVVYLGYSYLLAGASGTNYTIAKSDSYSYNTNFNYGGRGMFGAFLSGFGDNNMEALLTNLGTSGTVTQTLFKYSDPDYTSSGAYALTITTNANGTTTVSPTPVPLPAPVFLFGTGLAGIFGLSRKQTARG